MLNIDGTLSVSVFHTSELHSSFAQVLVEHSLFQKLLAVMFRLKSSWVLYFSNQDASSWPELLWHSTLQDVIFPALPSVSCTSSRLPECMLWCPMKRPAAAHQGVAGSGASAKRTRKSPTADATIDTPAPPGGTPPLMGRHSEAYWAASLGKDGALALPSSRSKVL